VEPRYLGYHVETKSGEVIYGVVVSESGDTLGLRQVDGQVRKLGRDSLEAITSSQRSFMPDGLEAELSSQDLADVMRYVGQLK
jgi:putative heme-binding domain-containing protein